MNLTDRTVRDLLTAFSSSDPTPGGGSAAALSSAIGASLLLMVAGLPKTRNGTDADRDWLAKVVSGIEPIRQSLTDAIDADTAAYDQVTAAYKLPKADAGEQAARKAAIQAALRAATEVPRHVIHHSLMALGLAAIVATHGNRSASSDVGVAIALLQAGAAGAKLNVDINLESLADLTYREAVRQITQTSMAEVEASAARAAALLA